MPGSGEVVLGRRTVDRLPGMADGGRCVASNQCQRGAVHLDHPGKAPELPSSTTTVPTGGVNAPSAPPPVGSSHRSTSRSRSSTPASSPIAISAPM
jgi:hypothetical protein